MLAASYSDAPSRQQAHARQDLLGLFVAGFGQQHLVRLLVDSV